MAQSLAEIGTIRPEKSLAEIVRSRTSIPKVELPAEEEPRELPVYIFTSDLVNTIMINDKPISLPYKTQNPFIAQHILTNYKNVIQVVRSDPEPLKYISLKDYLP